MLVKEAYRGTVGKNGWPSAEILGQIKMKRWIEIYLIIILFGESAACQTLWAPGHENEKDVRVFEKQ